MSIFDAIGQVIRWQEVRNLKSTIKQIEDLCRHRETTVFERHAGIGRTLTAAEHEKLGQLFGKLAEYFRNSERTTRESASSEAIRLWVEDPFLHQFLRSQSRLDTTSSSELFEIHLSLLFDGGLQVHELWSSILGTSDWWRSGSEHFEASYEALASSLRHVTLSFLAARYLYHLLKLPLEGNKLYYLVKIWHCYMDFVELNAERPERNSVIEWPIFNDCIRNLPSGEIRLAFVSPDRLAKFATRIINLRKGMLIPSIFSVFFSTPSLIFDVFNERVSGYRNQLSYSYKPVDKVHFRYLPLYYGSLLKSIFDAVTPPVLDPENAMLAALLGGEDLVVGTVLETKSLWSHYLGVLHEVSGYYSWGFVLHGGTPVDLTTNFQYALRLNDPVSAALERFLTHSIELLQSRSKDTRALADVLVASFASIDHYCMHAMETIHDSLPRLLYHASSQSNDIRRRIGLPRLPLFDNVPYLRRFRVHGRTYITSDHLPEPPDILLKSANTLYALTVDTMVLSGDVVLWLHIGYESYFRSEGHYPVLASHGKRHQQIYVAAVKVQHIYYFTCVVDGASSVVYTDEIGDEHVAEEFFVLAQRRSDAFDAIWRTFWPRSQRDSDYYPVSGSAKQDDDHLESLLKSFSRDFMVIF